MQQTYDYTKTQTSKKKQRVRKNEEREAIQIFPKIDHT